MAVRIDASGEYCRRTASLPTSGSFTLMTWITYVASRSNWAYLFGVENATSTAASGLYVGWDTSNSFHLYVTGGAGYLAFTPQPVVGQTICVALVASSTGASGCTAYYRQRTSNTWHKVTDTGLSQTNALVIVGNDSYDEWSNVKVWNTKCWDRPLSEAELLRESLSAEVANRDRLNFHWPLDYTADVFDRGGRGRSATLGGTPTTEPPAFLFPKGKARRIFYAAAGGDVSVALTGQAATASVGTLGVTHTQAITGVLVSSASGAVIGSGSIALAGSAITTANGTVSPVSVVALAGAAATLSAGTVVPTFGLPLSGESVTTSTGSLAVVIAVALSGSSITLSQGTLTASTGSDVSVALTGQAVTLSAGTLIPVSALALSGTSVSVSTGSLIAAISAGLTGGSVTFAAGTLVPGSAIPLSGGSITFSTGTVTAVGGSASATITIKAGSWLRYRIIQ